MSQIGMCGFPHLILKHLISSVVSLAQLVSPSVALPAELVYYVFVINMFNPLSPGVLDPGNYPGGVLRTHSYILPFLGFFIPPSINVKPHIE